MDMQSFINRFRQGMSFPEIIVVTAVLIILYSFTGSLINSLTRQGEVSAAKASMYNVESALTNYDDKEIATGTPLWNGPYAEPASSDYQMDAWVSKNVHFRRVQQIWLHEAENAVGSGYPVQCGSEGADFLTSISRLKP
ncbi:MAG: type II secretion system protein [Candidatus Riflebacteria bacterium]|nr:type II secretion system protein [Candidatus Riflebacteria bacterium]